MKRPTRAIALLLTVLLAIPFILPASALAPVHNVSGEYLASPYYARLSELQLTGDTRTDILLIALTQLGYHEGDSDADMGGGNTAGSRNFVEFNRLHGKVDNLEGNGVSYGYYWCCAFATWCVRQAGVSKDIAPSEISCRRLVSKLDAMGVYHDKSDGYRPRPGDFIFFRDAGSSYATHIGLVLYVDGATVYTIEGNSSTDNVAKRSYPLTDNYVLGFGSPAYSQNSAVAVDFNPKTAGYRLGDAYYSVTASVLNIRAGAGAEYDVLGTLKNGELGVLLGTQGNWARIRYGEGEGWISLSYVQYVPVPVEIKDLPASVTVTTEGKQHHLLSGEEFVLPTLPTRLSEQPKAFLWRPIGWDMDGDGDADAVPGDVLHPTEDITATAIFEKQWTEYTVDFIRPDGSHIAQQQLHYGDLPVPPDGSATVPEDGSRFVGWDAELVPVTGNVTYTAVYEQPEPEVDPPEVDPPEVEPPVDTPPTQTPPDTTPDTSPAVDTPTLILIIAAAAAVVILAVVAVLLRKKRVE